MCELCTPSIVVVILSSVNRKKYIIVYSFMCLCADIQKGSQYVELRSAVFHT